MHRSLTNTKFTIHVEGQLDPIEDLKTLLYKNVTKEEYLELPPVNFTKHWGQYEQTTDGLGYFLNKKVRYPISKKSLFMQLSIDKGHCSVNLTVQKVSLFEDFVYPLTL